MNGQGIFTFVYGDIYEGEWKENEKHGHGRITYANGSAYEGEWKNDKKHGYGKTIEEGYWKDGEFIESVSQLPCIK